MRGILGMWNGKDRMERGGDIGKIRKKLVKFVTFVDMWRDNYWSHEVGTKTKCASNDTRIMKIRVKSEN
jgi:hypothetical protein